MSHSSREFSVQKETEQIQNKEQIKRIWAIGKEFLGSMNIEVPCPMHREGFWILCIEMDDGRLCILCIGRVMGHTCGAGVDARQSTQPEEGSQEMKVWSCHLDWSLRVLPVIWRSWIRSIYPNSRCSLRTYKDWHRGRTQSREDCDEENNRRW